MSSSPWIAIGLTLFIWWFSTGAILWGAKRMERHSHAAQTRTVIFALPVAIFGGWLFWGTTGDVGITSIYGACISAILIWGWVEFAFLTGVICGPNRSPLTEGRPAWERFLRAWGAIAYHDMLLAGVLIAMGIASWHLPNQFAFWTFAVLLFARISAQLNLFLGVSQVNTDFLPDRLAHMASHFRIARMNMLFPLSISLLTLAAGCWMERALHYDDPGLVAGFAMLGALTILALVEHWMLMSRLPDDRLWRWLLPDASLSTKTKQAQDGL